jgi:hypothetical protein
MKKILFTKQHALNALLISSILGKGVGRTVRKSLLFMSLALVFLASSCKDDDDDAEPLVTAATGIRLIHGAYLTATTPADLYIDDVKVTTSGTIMFPNASAYYPLATGSRKLVAKSATGTILADTTLNVADGTQYSLFIRDRSFVNPTTTLVEVLKRGLVPVPDNNTTVPAAGTAKVRFVNMSSQPINAFLMVQSFLLVNPTGSVSPTTALTQGLGVGNAVLFSDYISFPAGAVTLRVHGAVTATNFYDTTNTTDLTTTLQPGKLYTVYATSTQYTVRTPTKSPLTLNIVANN